MWLNFSAATCEITTLGRANVTKETAHKKNIYYYTLVKLT